MKLLFAIMLASCLVMGKSISVKNIQSETLNSVWRNLSNVSQTSDRVVSLLEYLNFTGQFTANCSIFFDRSINEVHCDYTDLNYINMSEWKTSSSMPGIGLNKDMQYQLSKGNIMTSKVIADWRKGRFQEQTNDLWLKQIPCSKTNSIERGTPSHSLTIELRNNSFHVLPQPANNSFPAMNAVSSALAITTTTLSSFNARSQIIVATLSKLSTDGCNAVPEEKINEKPSFVESPLQIRIGSGGYMLGTIIGNILFVAIVFLSIISARYIWVRVRGKDVEEKSSLARVVIDSKSVNITTTISILLLDPILSNSFSLMFIGTVSKEWRIISPFITLIFLVMIGVVIYRSLYARNILEQFERKERKELSSIFKRIVNVFMKPEGEWAWPEFLPLDEDKKLFELALPLIEGYVDRAPRFFVIDTIVVVCLSLTIILGFSIGNRIGCIIKAVTMIIILFLYLIATIYLKPTQELFLKIMIPLTTALQMLGIGLALADIASEVIGVILSFLTFVMIIVTVSSVFYRVFSSEMAKLYKSARNNSDNVQTWQTSIYNENTIDSEILADVMALASAAPRASGINIEEELEINLMDNVHLVDEVEEPTQPLIQEPTTIRLEIDNVWDLIDNEERSNIIDDSIDDALMDSMVNNTRTGAATNPELDRRRVELSSLLSNQSRK